MESLGGALVVVPVSALAAWSGGTATGVLMGGDVPDDYDRACAVDGPAGVLPVGNGGVRALVLGDEPDTSCYLAGHRAFLRWLAADSESDLKSAAEDVLADPATRWDACGTWVTDGPAVLMDAAVPGAELNEAYPDGGMPEQAPVSLQPGRWRVRAVRTWADPRTCVGLVQFLPAGAGEVS
ncbi:Imm21 family immunity protein [Nocardiopsis suaedae]|uniref:Imm21 family immunity protein n=1 Tax=Nocardiopsis suaedae TaxID=3018444 RepID=A0ABT4TH78_9ACTN|nr:Imm21 family immunity protein [Nocardiopsis suaedae]MDA2804055.1 Imm21 family immunity protein [Nocardiopsis suaedae]